MEKGYFITFEGADGCGKTTQAQLIKTYLEEKQKDCILTREPGAGDLGKKIREILLYYDKPLDNRAELFLYLADRAQHTKEEIISSLNNKKIILCDRYIDSTVAYQGYARGFDVEKLKFLNEFATDGLKPDLTIVFDVDSNTAQSRLGKTKDRLESEGIEFHKKIRMGYLELAKSEPERIKVVDANRSIEEIFNDTKKLIGNILNI